MRINNITELIGNTPIIEINKEITGLSNINLFAKLEYLNPLGSLKDRAALALVQDELEDLKLNNKTVIEASSGNTAKALAVICGLYGVKFKTVTNRIKVPETRDILKIVGAEIEELPGLSECPDPNDPNDPNAYIERIVSSDNSYFHPNQYTNLKNPRIHYMQTGREIFNDIGKVDYFFGTLGTTGSTRGTSTYLKEKNDQMKNIGIVATKGDNIPGIRNLDEMHEVGIFDASLYDEILSVSSMDGIEGMITLNRKLGILAGPTSGAAFFATLKYLKELDKKLDEKINAVFIACDRVEWYMSYIKKRRSDLFDESIQFDSVRKVLDEDLKYAKVLEANEVENFTKEENSIIIDLRGSLAYKNGHIKGAINITDMFFDDIVDNGIPFDKETKILLACAVGDKSLRYSAFLNKKGLNTFSLSGGMVEYRDMDLPLQRDIKRINL